MAKQIHEIQLDINGAPYSTLYLQDNKIGMDTPNGLVWKEVPKSLYKELVEYANEEREAS